MCVDVDFSSNRNTFFRFVHSMPFFSLRLLVYPIFSQCIAVFCFSYYFPLLIFLLFFGGRYFSVFLSRIRIVYVRFASGGFSCTRTVICGRNTFFPNIRNSKNNNNVLLRNYNCFSRTATVAAVAVFVVGCRYFFNPSFVFAIVFLALLFSAVYFRECYLRENGFFLLFCMLFFFSFIFYLSLPFDFGII